MTQKNKISFTRRKGSQQPGARQTEGWRHQQQGEHQCATYRPPRDPRTTTHKRNGLRAVGRTAP
eukprot:6888201-Prymnesium_polylepis.3